MDTNTKGEKIYFDANFLIYWFISKEPELKKRARSLLAEFLINNNDLYSSALALDEAWWGIKDEYNQQNGVNFSCGDNDVFEKLSQFTKLILAKLNLAQFADIKNGVEDALDNIKNFNLKPRDAFHLATMKDNGIKIIVTGDEDFIGNQVSMGISVQLIM
ncbi:type II toxin-antitoxin system VapC family toxin [Patescibacteria group bacterium]|nr:type II toxin-antitoxin system VapC family toxin [Patescibacteria group bacterium]MBU4455573.1 type II toxin-antitoxin system VapC family toxin [Patescibacteria group bacterium]MCG2691123.1 type II toxin-antitoxin system VapC family toxin [Candidatus Parcubacteria bacterium]